MKKKSDLLLLELETILLTVQCAVHCKMHSNFPPNISKMLCLLIYFFIFSEPPKSFSIIKENLPIELGTEITVVDGKLETVHCESRKSNPAPLLEWFLGKRMRTKIQ